MTVVCALLIPVVIALALAGPLADTAQSMRLRENTFRKDGR